RAASRRHEGDGITMNAVKFLGVAALTGVLVGCGSSNNDTQSSPSMVSDGGVDDAAVGDGGPVNAGGPVTGLQPMKWVWADVNGAFCRDGTPTGVAVSQGSGAGADKLMIYLEGGGACFNAATCLLNPSTFKFSSWSNGTSANAGLFDRSNAMNPVKDWNFVYVPYCTGDVHAGNNPTATIPNVTGTKFVGYQNMTLALQRILPTFTNLSKVFLTGISAGGFGAAANYVQVAKA